MLAMDGFKVLKSLGEGSFGSALLVQDLRSRKCYVVKRVSLLDMNQKQREEALKEVEVLSQMQHPNIITYHKSFEENNNLYIVTDYCDGGDLHSVIQRQRSVPFKENQILDWFVQICLAVKHVHDRKILHRDIKTQNIFLTKSGIAKLGDFGIARILTSTSDLARTCIGTPYYLSPEICENKPYNNKSDIWSLGCVLYELIALKHAFEAKNIKSLMFKIIKSSTPTLPEFYSQEIKTLLNQMFRKLPSERPSINAILRKPIILKRICKFLDEKKIKEEFSHTVIHKSPSLPSVADHVNCSAQKVDITNPAAKYGVSISRKNKQQKLPVKKLLADKSVDILKRKCLNNQNKIQSNFTTNSGDRSEKNYQIKHDKNSSNAEEYNLRKSLLSEESILLELRESTELDSHKVNSHVSLPSIANKENTNTNTNTNTITMNNEQTSSQENSFSTILKQAANDIPYPSIDESSKTFFETPDSFANNSKCSILPNADSNQKTTNTRVSLPNVCVDNLSSAKNRETCISRPKWGTCLVDIFKDMPLEETASNMEATSGDDRVIVYQRRPHSAPISGKTLKPDQNMALKTEYTPFTPCELNNFVNLYPILDDDELDCTTSVALGNGLNNQKCLNTEGDDDKQHIRVLSISKEGISSHKNVLNNEGDQELYVVSHVDKETPKFDGTYSVNVQKSTGDQVSPKLSLEGKQIEKNENFPTVVAVNKMLPLNNEQTVLPRIENPQQTCFYKTFVVNKAEKNENINSSLPAVFEEDACNLLNENDVIEINKIITDHTENVLLPLKKAKSNDQVNVSSVFCKCSAPVATIETGVQCEMNDYEVLTKFSNLSLQGKSQGTIEPDITAYPKEPFNYNKEKKYRYQRHSCSLPDLRKISCTRLEYKDFQSFSCLSPDQLTSPRPKKTVMLSDSSSHSDESYKTASEIEFTENSDDDDDLYYVCQSMRFILQESHILENDVASVCSLAWTQNEQKSPDIFQQLEEMRIDLEAKLGLSTLLEAYKEVQSVFENEGECGFSTLMEKVLQRLNPDVKHFANKILDLVIKEEAFISYEVLNKS